MKKLQKVISVMITLSLLLSCASFAYASTVVENEDGTYTYTDNFDSYNESNSAYGSENRVTAPAQTSPFNMQTVAENSSCIWKLSGYWCGRRDLGLSVNSYCII